MSEFRHELKHELGTAELLALRQRLRAVLDPDKHSPDGRYSVRSLYFDDARGTALLEKHDGVGSRQKFRLRLYNGDPRLRKAGEEDKTQRPLLQADGTDACGHRPGRHIRVQLDAGRPALAGAEGAHGLGPAAQDDRGLHARGLHLPGGERQGHARL